MMRAAATAIAMMAPATPAINMARASEIRPDIHRNLISTLAVFWATKMISRMTIMTPAQTPSHMALVRVGVTLIGSRCPSVVVSSPMGRSALGAKPGVEPSAADSTSDPGCSSGVYSKLVPGGRGITDASVASVADVGGRGMGGSAAGVGAPGIDGSAAPGGIGGPDIGRSAVPGGDAGRSSDGYAMT
jgi:hypothetical protein